jgi:outer membrane protein TolC
MQVTQYEYVIQTAFREVTDGLTARGTPIRESRPDSMTRSLNSACSSGRSCVTGGIDSCLLVLAAQNDVYASR